MTKKTLEKVKTSTIIFEISQTGISSHGNTGVIIIRDKHKCTPRFSSIEAVTHADG